jgi:hypothetical protein
MTCRYVTANPLDDLYGVEYSAVMKNIVALACGITHGLGYGDNFQAVLVSNAMQEIGRLVTALDPRERDLSSSAYLGDLLVTPIRSLAVTGFWQYDRPGVQRKSCPAGNENDRGRLLCYQKYPGRSISTSR